MQKFFFDHEELTRDELLKALKSYNKNPYLTARAAVQGACTGVPEAYVYLNRVAEELNDPDAAEFWAFMAALTGDGSAYVKMADKAPTIEYENYWLLKNPERLDAQGNYRLAVKYMNGHGLMQDPFKAKIYFERAKRKNYEDSIVGYNYLDSLMKHENTKKYWTEKVKENIDEIIDPKTTMECIEPDKEYISFIHINLHECLNRYVANSIPKWEEDYYKNYDVKTREFDYKSAYEQEEARRNAIYAKQDQVKKTLAFVPVVILVILLTISIVTKMSNYVQWALFGGIVVLLAGMSSIISWLTKGTFKKKVNDKSEIHKVIEPLKNEFDRQERERLTKEATKAKTEAITEGNKFVEVYYVYSAWFNEKKEEGEKLLGLKFNPGHDLFNMFLHVAYFHPTTPLLDMKAVVAQLMQEAKDATVDTYKPLFYSPVYNTDAPSEKWRGAIEGKDIYYESDAALIEVALYYYYCVLDTDNRIKFNPGVARSDVQTFYEIFSYIKKSHKWTNNSEIHLSNAGYEIFSKSAEQGCVSATVDAFEGLYRMGNEGCFAFMEYADTKNPAYKNIWYAAACSDRDELTTDDKFRFAKIAVEMGHEKAIELINAIAEQIQAEYEEFKAMMDAQKEKESEELQRQIEEEAKERRVMLAAKFDFYERLNNYKDMTDKELYDKNLIDYNSYYDRQALRRLVIGEE